MKLPSHVQSSVVKFNMTPMIDVVFLLIIFFLLSSHLARRENQIELSLPTAVSGEEPWNESARRVTVNVLPDGTLMLGGRNVSTTDLDTRLTTVYQELGARTELRIRADRAVAYRHVSAILAAASHSGIWNVTFSVIRPEDSR